MPKCSILRWAIESHFAFQLTKGIFFHRKLFKSFKIKESEHDWSGNVISGKISSSLRTISEAESPLFSPDFPVSAYIYQLSSNGFNKRLISNQDALSYKYYENQMLLQQPA